MTRFSIGMSAIGMVSLIPLPTHAQSTEKRVLQPVHVSARAAILVDSRTGAILYEKNAFMQMDPASVTKMMTALLVIEHGHLNRIVTISQRADNTHGSSMHVAKGQQYTRLDLLKGLLLRSGNDASVALAESDAGSVEKFVAQMNVKAQQIGAFNTAFENPNGLTKPGHYSSAYDLALIARTALREPLFQEIVKTPETHVTELRHQRTRTIRNTNQLLYGFPGADGVKTGTTDAAGKCLVASATRNGQQLIAVVLHSDNRWGDASRLLHYGFHHWALVDAVPQGRVMAEAAVVGGRAKSVGLVTHRSIWVDIPVSGEGYQLHLATRKQLRAPVTTRRPAGFVSVEVLGQPPAREALYPRWPVKALSIPKKFWNRSFGPRQPR